MSSTSRAHSTPTSMWWMSLFEMSISCRSSLNRSRSSSLPQPRSSPVIITVKSLRQWQDDLVNTNLTAQDCQLNHIALGSTQALLQLNEICSATPRGTWVKCNEQASRNEERKGREVRRRSLPSTASNHLASLSCAAPYAATPAARAAREAGSGTEAAHKSVTISTLEFKYDRSYLRAAQNGTNGRVSRVSGSNGHTSLARVAFCAERRAHG